MSVTSFRTYLASPYLFYLKHVLGLGEADDSAVELDPLAFGSLVHKVLEDFGRSDVKASSDAEEIRQFVGDALADRARRAYGAEPGMAVRLQLNFAQWRLERFAAWQAQRRAAGWRIDREPEWRPAGQAVEFAAGDVSIRLRGKIDRIDRHEVTGQLAILDYKTSEDPQTPQRAHTFKGAWCDLQLPLYRHLAAELLQGEEPVLGYVCVSSAAHGTDLKEAEWDAADLADADATAREVVRAVKAGEFDEVNELDYEDGSLAAICRLARLAQAQRDEDGAVVKNGGTP
jgi:ATP-dependent helicase/DNAse subunit B